MNRDTKRWKRPQKEFEELLLEVRRVTRVTTGWRRLSFRATILVGNKNGKIGVGVAKGPDVAVAVRKATNEAYKQIFVVPLTNADTVPYALVSKFKAAVVKLLPASAGTWLKAWSSVRSVLELAWYQNMLSKIMGSNNKLNNAIATINALAKYKHADHFTARRDINQQKAANESTKTSEEKDTTEKKSTTNKSAEKPITTKKAVEKKPSAAKKAPAAKKTTTKKAPAKKTDKK